MIKLTDTIKKEIVNAYLQGEPVLTLKLKYNMARSSIYSIINDYTTPKDEENSLVSNKNYIKLQKLCNRKDDIICILKTVNCTVKSNLQERLQELSKLHGQYSVHILCEAMEVDRGTFYNHLLRNKKTEKSYFTRRLMLSEKIKSIYEDSNRIYGSKKIKAVLNNQDIVVSERMVAELMYDMNIKSIRNETKKTYTKLHKRKTDHIRLKFTANEPNQVWVSDITQFRVHGTTLYICAILDLYSRKLIAHKVSKKNSTNLTTSTFKKAYCDRTPNDGLIFHSDRGSQYTAYAFQKLLTNLNVTHSFSPTASPQNNAVMEAFFSNLKKEEIYRVDYRSVNKFEQRISAYMYFYNNERPHTTILYNTPNAF